MISLLAGFAEMIVNMVKSPLENAPQKIEHIYTGPQDTELAQQMMKCDQDVNIIYFHIVWEFII